MLGVKIKEYKTETSNKLIDDFLPSKISYTISKKDKALVKNDEDVKINAKILIKDNITLTSPINGKIKLLKTKLIIENNYKEEIESNIIDESYTYTRSEILKIMNENNLKDFYSNKILKDQYNIKKINTLIVSAIDDEPYVTSSMALINNNYIEILKSIDWLMHAFNIKECIIAISKKDSELKKKLSPYLNSKIKIKEVVRIYPINLEDNLLKYINHKNKICVSNNIVTIYDIYNLLKYNHKTNDRIITFISDNIKTNIRVKIGTNIKDILEYLRVNDENIIINGLMRGHILKKDEVIDEKTNSIFVRKDNDFISKKCIKCAKCNDICPVKINPSFVLEGNLLNSEKCISCGLCTYICPSRIDLLKKIRKDDI